MNIFRITPNVLRDLSEIKYTTTFGTTSMTPSYDDVLKAKSTKGDEIKKTPLVHSPTFSRLTGSDVYLKSEFQQKTGSFKIRGAYYKIKSLTDEEKKNGIIAASSGNHGQGVAYASQVEKIPCISA